jgi:geranyl-CoA carboxylase alpha subunit
VRAVESTVALGIVTNKEFLLRLLESETFIDGRITTDFVERWMREEGAGSTAVPGALPALAALLLSGAAERTARTPAATGRLLPWALTLDDGATSIEVRGDAMGRLEVLSIGGGEVVYVEDGVRRSAVFVRDGDSIWIEAQRSIGSYRVRTGRARAPGAEDDDELRAPIAAQVVAVVVAVGDRVEQGAALVTLRAMKLEHQVAAPRVAVVREILVREGDQVAFRQVLVRLETAAPTAAVAGEPAAP